MNAEFLVKGMVTSYISSPQGVETICRFVSSDAGQRAIRDYLSTAPGKQIVQEILPLLLEAGDLPDDLKNAVRENFEKKN